MITSAQEWIGRELWRVDPATPAALRFLRSTAQLIALTARGFESHELLLRASALTYITAISIIPMLGVMIAILGLVGVNQTIVNFAIDQLTTVAPDVRETVRGYAAGLDFGSFGAVGGAIVFGTAIFALRHLERTLNNIWGVDASRSWARRFSDYLAVMVVGPISVGVAVSLATTLQSEPVLSSLLDNPFFAKVYGLGLSQVPMFVLFLGFTFLYWFFPNTNVQLRAAALGGAVAAVLFSVARAIYVDFQVGAATYQAVFGALAAVPLILAWLYVCWAVLLLGAEVAFAMQNLPFARREMSAGDETPAKREVVAIEIAVDIASDFLARRDPPSSSALADHLNEPIRLVRRIVTELEEANLVRAVTIDDEDQRAWVPARPAREVTIGDVLRAVRGEAASDASPADAGASDDRVAELLSQLKVATGEVADHTSLESLARPSEGDSPGGAA